MKAEKAILLSVAILIEITVITISMLMLRNGQSSGNTALGDYAAIDADLADEFKAIDKESVGGVELRSLAMKYYDRLTIMITTADYPQGFYDVSTIDDSNSQYFIPESLQATCNVIPNANGDPIGLMFTQAGISEAEFDKGFAEDNQSVNQLDQIITNLQYSMRHDLTKRNNLAYQVAHLELKEGTAEFQDKVAIASAISAMKQTTLVKQQEKEHLEARLEDLYRQLEKAGEK